MNAATYQFYTESYFGNEIAAADFNRLIIRAKTYLDSVKTVEFPDTDAVRMAQCAVAEAWQKNEQGGDVVSQSVGGWSQSFTQNINDLTYSLS